ncbi:acyltransferase [Pseudomonas juntendi]|uniref:acyltransferase family protein n=1 Tax=Pseudomonas TaxID=286 RepID=UPI0034D673FC
MNNPSTNGTRLESLTFLRFIAALVVVIYHFGKNTTLHDILPSALTSGPIMVTFFFVLSGFVISTAYYGRDFATSSFYKNRFFRIAPIYLIALFATAALQPSAANSTSLILSATFLQSWIPGHAISINFPGWSISVEAFFYALSPALLIIANSANKPSWKSWVAASILIWIVTQSVLSALLDPTFYKGYKTFSHDLIYYFPVSHLTSFVLGFSAGVAFHQNKGNHFVSPSTASILFVVSLLAAGYVIQNLASVQSTFGVNLAFGSSFLALLFMPMIYFCAIGDSIIKKYLALPIMVLLGEASYGMYILQKPVFVAFNSIDVVSTLSPDARFFVYAAFLLIISVASFMLIESPITKAFKRTRPALFPQPQ